MRRFPLFVLGFLLSAAACVATNPHVQPVPVATNGPKACLAAAEWTTETRRIAHSHTYETRRMGERLACDVARMQLAERSASVCQVNLGSRTDIRNLTAATQFSGVGQGCNCLDFGMWTRCEVEGDAVCGFAAAVPGTGDCAP